MANGKDNIVFELGGKLSSPSVIAEIDAALKANERQRGALENLRKAAISLHGEQPSAKQDGEQLASIVVHDNQSGGLTVAELVHRYRTDEDSPFQTIRFSTRANYEQLLMRVERDLGKEAVSTLDSARMERAHHDWSVGGTKLTIAHSLIAMMRILATFGAKNLKDRASRELKLTLHEMRIPKSTAARTERLTVQQAEDIIRVAHAMGRPSIALAQAFQIDCGLKQKDVIGEWVPESEPGDSVIRHKGLKWVRGLRWEQIDRRGMVRLITSQTGEQRYVDIPTHRLVMQEVSRKGFQIGSTGNEGPIIVYEKTGLPYLAHQFRRVWRQVAKEAGVPDAVVNRDSSLTADDDE